MLACSLPSLDMAVILKSSSWIVLSLFQERISYQHWLSMSYGCQQSEEKYFRTMPLRLDRSARIKSTSISCPGSSNLVILFPDSAGAWEVRFERGLGSLSMTYYSPTLGCGVLWNAHSHSARSGMLERPQRGYRSHYTPMIR